MKKVFIKYNPYTIETTITVDEKQLADNSTLGERSANGSRLQEWVEDLPQLLIDEYNDNDFDITFYGTLLDYEDLKEVFTKAYKENKLTAKLERTPEKAKETADKELLIDKVFEKIQNGPFEKLKEDDVINSFNKAKSEDFEVVIVGTMSAGKSTFINAILQSKLMPASSEAKTAIITRIKDNDKPNWRAEVYSKDSEDGKPIETYEELTYQTMDRLNSDENVSEIRVTGDIPFVTAEDTSLVLVDTPGPNNARDEKHKEVQNNFLDKDSKTLVIYIMEATFSSKDANDLINEVSARMSVGGKQSKDRFIFVVNKMDARRANDGNIEGTLDRARAYLKSKHIYNPNLFPIAALPALDIRMIEAGIETDEIVILEAAANAAKLNKYLNLEKYATLPKSAKDGINEQLNNAIEAQNVMNQALIHTGIISVEAAIRQYVQKYAKTAKIKNIVDTFIHKLDSTKYEETLKNKLVSDQKEAQRIIKQIDDIQNKINDAREATRFSDSVDAAVSKVKSEAREVSQNIVKKFKDKIIAKIKELDGRKLSIDGAESELQELKKFAKELEPDFQYELNKLIGDNLKNTCDKLLKNYRDKLSSLKEEKNNSTLPELSIDPLSLMSGTVSSYDISKYIRSEDVKDGEEWVKNTDKKWYKPWTWFQESGYYRTKWKTVKYVDAGTMAEEYLQPIQDVIFENGDNAVEYASKQSEKISKYFKEEFKRLDNLLKDKLNELKNYATNKDEAEARIKETESKLKWLEEIKREVESILEI